MIAYFQQLDIYHIFYVVLTFADNFLFAFYMVAVGYLFIFSVSSNFRKKHTYPTAKKSYRYAVMFYVNSDKMTVKESVTSFFKQTYPNYEVVVVSNPNYVTINEELSKMPVKLLMADAQKYNKAASIRYAVANLEDKAYDAIVIMNPASEVDETFLQEINKVYYSGNNFIQTHRIAKKMESDTALFGAVSEEINNSIFRRGHVNIGFSSALIGSGMVFKFEWMKKNIHDITNADLERQLETKLLEQSIFIEYLNDVHVYDEKIFDANEFYKERSTWLTSQKHSVRNILHKLPVAIIQGNYDYCDKLIQWLIPSRMIIAGTLLMIAIALLFVSWTIALKWWVLLITLIFTFSIALPDYLIDTRFIKALRGAPILFVWTVFNSLKRKLSHKK